VPGRLAVDDGHVVAGAGELVGDRHADDAGAEDEDLHAAARNRQHFTRRCGAGGRARVASCGCGIIRRCARLCTHEHEETRMVDVIAWIVVAAKVGAP
jgi:hypothetical protein